MPAQRGGQSRTRLAQWRLRRSYSQAALARATGLTRSTYWRLEHGEFDNPPVRYLTNLAIALDCPNGISDICEPEWLEWTVFDAQHAASPPDAPRPQ